MKQYNIVIGYYPDLFYRNGGLQGQVRNTIKALKNSGHNVMHYYEWIQNPCSIDIYHQFGLEPSTFRIFSENRKIAKKVVISPIFQTLPNSIKQRIKFLNKIPKLNFQGYNYQKEMVNKSDGFIFLGNNEKVELESFFNIDIKKFKNIPNGIDLFYHDNLSILEENYIISVGTICRRKNQKLLIKACMDLGITLKLIGPIGEQDYYNECLAIADNTIEFLGELNNKSTEFYKLLANSKIFCLVSKSEVLPISIFEALSLGKKVVSTNRCSVNDYIVDDEIVLCNPYDIEDIKSKIQYQISNQKVILKEEYRNKYSWDNVANNIVEFYSKIL